MFDRRKKRSARADDDPTSLGNILVDLGYCRLDDIRLTVRHQRKRTPTLGSMLVERNIITNHQLEHALLRQQVLRGHDDPAKLKRFGASGRLSALSDMAERLQRAAAGLAQKPNR